MLDVQTLTPFIVIVVYIIAEFLKVTVIKTDKMKKLLPIICAVIGAIISVIVYKFYPQGTNATNYVDAFTSGAFSGIATTGCNQIYKQIKKFRTEDDE